jgi:hypothetical protein
MGRLLEIIHHAPGPYRIAFAAIFNLCSPDRVRMLMSRFVGEKKNDSWNYTGMTCVSPTNTRRAIELCYYLMLMNIPCSAIQPNRALYSAVLRGQVVASWVLL